MINLYTQDYAATLSIGSVASPSQWFARIISEQSSAGKGVVQTCRMSFMKDIVHASAELKMCEFLHGQLFGRLEKLCQENKVSQISAHRPIATHRLEKVA